MVKPWRLFSKKYFFIAICLYLLNLFLFLVTSIAKLVHNYLSNSTYNVGKNILTINKFDMPRICEKDFVRSVTTVKLYKMAKCNRRLESIWNNHPDFTSSERGFEPKTCLLAGNGLTSELCGLNS